MVHHAEQAWPHGHETVEHIASTIRTAAREVAPPTFRVYLSSSAESL